MDSLDKRREKLNMNFAKIMFKDRKNETFISIKCLAPQYENKRYCKIQGEKS